MLLSSLLALGLAADATAQPREGDPRFGMEFEFAGDGNRIPLYEKMTFENYTKIMRQIVQYYGGRVSDIKKVEFEKDTTNLEKFPDGVRTLFRAEWKDPRGRVWRIEPEFVASTGFHIMLSWPYPGVGTAFPNVVLASLRLTMVSYRTIVSFPLGIGVIRISTATLCDRPCLMSAISTVHDSAPRTNHILYRPLTCPSLRSVHLRSGICPR